MADDLMFPPSDPLSYIDDLDQNILQNDNLVPNLDNDLNPSFLQSELLNIPPLVPNMVSPTTEIKRQPTSAMQHSNYAPINQLMKQTDQLSQTLDSPLGLQQQQQQQPQLSFGNSISNQRLLTTKQSPNNNAINFPVTNQLNNSTQLLVGGQRAQILSQNSLQRQSNLISLQQNQTSQQQTQRTSLQLLQQQQQLLQQLQQRKIAAQQSSQHQQKTPQPQHLNSSGSVQSPLNRPLSVATVQKEMPSLQAYGNSPQSHQQNTIEVSQNIQVKPSVMSNSVNRNPEVPVSTATGNKLKGQIVRTSDQRYMFVTNLNGKSVGYYIQQPTGNSASAGQTVTQSTTSLGSPHNLGSPQLASDTPSVQSTFASSPVVNDIVFTNTQNSVGNVVNNPVTIENPQNMPSNTIMSTNSTLKPAQERDKLATKFVKSGEGDIEKKEQYKKIQDKLLSLRKVVTRNQADNSKVDQISLGNKISEPPSEAVSSSPSDNMETPEVMTIIDSSDEEAEEKEIEKSPEQLVRNTSIDFLIGEEDDEEEDGQEIEFSENDLSANVVDNSPEEEISPVIEDTPVKKETPDRTTSTDDEESVPLAMLKGVDINDEPMTDANDVIQEGLSLESTARKPKQPATIQRNESIDSVPLSVVAAKLKKTEDLPKKVKSKSKKKKKDPRQPDRPVPAYQLFFREEYKRLKEENPEVTFSNLSREVAAMWQKLEDPKKKVYRDEYLVAKVEYDKKMVEYKRMLSQEQTVSPPRLPSPVEPSSADTSKSDSTTSETVADTPMDDSDDEILASKRVNKRTSLKRKATKKTQKVQKKPSLIAETIETISNRVSPNPPQTMDIDEVRQANPSSPSLPSSSNTSSDEEFDREIAINRMKKRAEELKKKIKIEKKAVNKSKSKKSTRSTPRMEVVSETISVSETMSETETFLSEAISENDSLLIELETGSPKKDIKPVRLETTSQQDIPSLPLPSSPRTTENDPPSPATVDTKPIVSDNKVSSPKEEVVVPPPKKSEQTSSTVKKSKKKKVKKLEKIEKTEPSPEKEEEPISPPPPSLPKTTFRIPKKSSAGNNPTLPAGPRLCIRKSCSNPAKLSRERGAQYCSNECLVLYCREVFDSWVLDRQGEETTKT